MHETRGAGTGADAPPGVTMVVVPDEHVARVQEYVAALRKKEGETAGYAFSTPTTLRERTRGTMCHSTSIQGVPTPDTYCADIMTWS